MSCSQRPLVVATFDHKPSVVLLRDGRLVAFFIRTNGGSQEIAARISTDNGYSWEEAESWLELPRESGKWGGLLALVDRTGELHFFLLNDAHTGVFQTGEQRQKTILPLRLDIWHIKSKDGIHSWVVPKCIWKGYTGALNSVIQLRNERIILPFARFSNRYWGDHTGCLYDDYTYTGQYEVISLYSDDFGDTWCLSPSALRVPTPNMFAYGATEPVILELRDGRIWMVIRTQVTRI